ncbi:peptidoglycan DD-metalloendopeptidase family protein [Streptomyces narbonensis]|uniref:peptidoglycan DD-metalloendopeptidase family protein n=1 Tax=Streptomyces narbonensis TaxID=67333 RepID=UPI0033D506E3
MPAPEIAVAYVSIVPSLQGFQQELRQQVVGPAEDAGADAGAGMGAGLKDGLKAGAAAAAIAAGAVIVKSLTDAIEQSKISKTVQAQLGATGKEAAKYGKVAGDLYTSGVTETFEEGAQAIRKVMESGILPPDASNAQLQEIATKAADVANVFEQDLGGVTNAVSQMMKTGLAKNATEAFDILTKGFQNGANKADDLLDTFNEYGVQFQKLGLDGSEALGVITQLVKGGARDADIAADALKEFSIRAVDASESSAEAYKALGLDAEKMTAQIAKGGEHAQAGLQTVIDRLKAMKDPVAREAAAVGLFGTQAEDLGKALFELDPSKAVESLGKVGGASKEVGETIRNGPMHELKVFTRELQQGLVDVMSAYVLPALGNMIEAGFALGRAMVTAWNWVVDISPYLAPFAVGIAGITLAMNANAIATGIVTGVFAVYRAAILVGTAVTNGFAAAQGLLNAVMALNPFVLVVIALAALGTALYVAWTKSETFRNIVMGAWEGIQAAALWAWEKVLKPAFDGIVTGLKWVGDAAVWLWQNAIKPAFDGIMLVGRILLTAITVAVLIPIMVALKAVGWLAEWLWTDAIKPAFEGIAAVAMWLWTNGIKPAFDNFVEGLKTVGGWFTWLWTNGVKPTFDFIADKAIWLWNNGIKPSFNLLVEGLKNVAGWAKWLWTNGIKPTFDFIADKAVWLWDNGVKPAFNSFKKGIDAVGNALKWVWDNVLKPTFNFIGDKATWLWDKAVKPAFNSLKKGVDAVGDSFKKAKDFIGEQWGKLENIAKKPVKFIIDTVYNGGLVPLWNKVADAFGAPKLNKLSLKGFARGGVLPGTSSYRNGDDQLVPMRKGEGVYVSEAMKDPYERARLFAVNKAAMAGRSLSQFRDTGFGYAKGGVVGFAGGGILDSIGDVASGAWDKVKSGAEWLGDTIESSARQGVEHIVKPLLGKIPGANTGFGKMVRRVPDKILDSIFGFSKRADQKLGSGKWGKPVDAGIGTRYGVPGRMWSSGYHTGTDFPAPTGALIKAVQRGTIAAVGSSGPYGNHVRMNHPGGLSSLYAHMSSVAVRAGQSVAKGAGIGRVGATGNTTGPHLHLEAFKNGARLNPESLFDSGGWLQPGATMARNKTGKPEPILTASQWANVSTLASRGASGGLQPGDRLLLSTGAGADFEVYVDQRADKRIHDELTGPAGLGRRL